MTEAALTFGQDQWARIVCFLPVRVLYSQGRLFRLAHFRGVVRHVVCPAVRGVGGAGRVPFANDRPRDRAADLADIVERVEPSVVRIDTDLGIGSGVVVDAEKRWIVTNYHVIEGATTAKVTFRGGKTAKVNGYRSAYSTRDSALLEIEKPDDPLVPIPIRDGLPRKGEKVAAFGNPRGYSFSTSEGIVSAIRTGAELREMHGPSFDPASTWLQTTAAISGGNSGGPLVDMEGRLLGLNTWTRTDAQNLNFAIGAPDIKKMITTSRAGVKPLANLPRRKGEVAHGDKFKLAMPSRRQFSLDAFVFEDKMHIAPQTTDQVIVVKHSNGAIAVEAEHAEGVLDGRMLVITESKELKMLVSYQHGVHHGLMKHFDDSGEPRLFAQYQRGKRHGFECLFHSGRLRLIAEFDHDAMKSVQIMDDLEPRESFASAAEGEKDSNCGAMLKELAEAESNFKVAEIELKKEVNLEYKEYKKLRLKQLQKQQNDRGFR